MTNDFLKKSKIKGTSQSLVRGVRHWVWAMEGQRFGNSDQAETLTRPNPNPPEHVTGAECINPVP